MATTHSTVRCPQQVNDGLDRLLDDLQGPDVGLAWLAADLRRLDHHLQVAEADEIAVRVGLLTEDRPARA